MAGKSSSAGKKAQYTAYKAKDSYKKNRTRALNRHIDQHPNDDVAAKAVKNITYRRKTPKADQGWVTGKVMYDMGSYVGCNEKDRNFSGMHSKATQKKIAQYMRMSRKLANAAQYQQKKVTKK